MPIDKLLESLKQNKVLPIDVLHAYQVKYYKDLQVHDFKDSVIWF